MRHDTVVAPDESASGSPPAETPVIPELGTPPSPPSTLGEKASLRAPGGPPSPVRGSRQRRSKRWAVLAAIGALLLGGFAGYRYFTGHGQAPQYRTARVERGPLTATVAATGSLNAVITVLVGSQVSGTIKELDADFNTVVRTGQVIARIDPALFEAAVNQAHADLESGHSTVLNQEAQVEQARTTVENARAGYAEAKAQTAKALVAVVDARRTLGRQTELLQRDLIAAYDSAVAQHESAQAHEQALAAAIRTADAQLRVQQAALQTARNQVKQKQAALAQAQINLDHTTIRSPVDGVVVNRAVDVGQTVAATLQAPTLFTIAQDLTKMQVEASVDEADIGRIRPETPVTFTVDAFPGETFTGEVSQIRKAPQVLQNVVTYTVVVAVANPSGKLLPGMTANVRFVTAQEADVLKVPNVALRFRPSGIGESPAEGGPGPGGQQERQPPEKRAGAVVSTAGRVWVLGRDGRPVPIPVTLGMTDGTFTEVVRGELDVGQAILIGLESGPPAMPPTGGPGLRF